MKTGLKSSTKLSPVTINGFCDIRFHTKLKMISQITVNFMLMIVINHILYSSFNLIHLFFFPPKFESVVQLTQPSVSDSAWQPLWGGGDVLRSSAAPPQPLPLLPSELPWWISVWPIPCTRQSVRALWAPCTFFSPLDVIKFFVIKSRASLVSLRESRNKKDQLYLCPPQVDVNAECKLTDI